MRSSPSQKPSPVAQGSPVARGHSTGGMVRVRPTRTDPALPRGPPAPSQGSMWPAQKVPRARSASLASTPSRRFRLTASTVGYFSCCSRWLSSSSFFSSSIHPSSPKHRRGREYGARHRSRSPFRGRRNWHRGPRSRDGWRRSPGGHRNLYSGMYRAPRAAGVGLAK